MMMVLIMLIGDDSTMCHAVRHLADAPAPAAPTVVLGIPVVPVVDRAVGHPSTNARRTDSSRGGRRAIDPCGAEHCCASPYIGRSTRCHAKSDAAANARPRA